MISVIDHGTGNIASINNCLEKVDTQYQLVSEPNMLEEASHIIIPGVGHFESAMLNLQERALDDAIIKACNRGVPVLGICLGMQIFYEFSEEGNSDGLGLVNGRVVKKTPSNSDSFKVPNVGWLSVECKKESSLFQDINNDDTVFYFANSYAVKSDDQSYATSSYSFDDSYVASLEKGNIYGTQFHPEKSGDVGHKLMHNFLNIGQQT